MLAVSFCSVQSTYLLFRRQCLQSRNLWTRATKSNFVSKTSKQLDLGYGRRFASLQRNGKNRGGDKHGVYSSTAPAGSKGNVCIPEEKKNVSGTGLGGLQVETVATGAFAPSTSWIDTSPVIPAALRPYLHLARADKQVGTLLLLWPCLWSVSLAAESGCLPDFYQMGKFAVGAVVMRSAGCTINDLWDKDFDKHVERTRARPLASGQLSVPQALTFLGLQLACGLGVLVSFNTPTIILGLCSMPLVVAYPLMKRFTNWPQLVLGCTFNWGALVGWTAIAGDLSLAHTLPLYLAGVSWTLVYDTIYGYQDRKDDAKIGIYILQFIGYVGQKWPSNFPGHHFSRPTTYNCLELFACLPYLFGRREVYVTLSGRAAAVGVDRHQRRHAGRPAAHGAAR